VAEGIRAELEREPSPYDSHPSPKQRIEWVRALGVAGSESSADDAVAAWQLFRDRESIERRLTKEIRDQVAKYDGIVIRAEA
jgi:hypothetical protein